MIFAERLRELRMEKDLTQDELARATELSHGCIAMLETNKRAPSGSTIIALAEFFEVSTDYLLGLEDDIGVKKFYAPIKNESFAELTPAEQELLKDYRSLAPYLQDMLRATIQTWKGTPANTAKNKQA